MLISLALALSYMERFLPLQLLIPLPGVKLGLPNIVTLIALYLLGPASAFAILVPRCIMGAIFGGGITGLFFSLTGGLLAMSMMVLARKMRLFSIFGVSVLGAAAHSVGQILVAMVLMRTSEIGYYMIVLAITGTISGIFIGLCGSFLVKRFNNIIK